MGINEKDKKGSSWPLAIAGGLALVFMVNFGFLFAAIATDDGLTDEDYYEKGLFYDRLKERQEALGWDVDFSVTRSADLAGVIEVRVTGPGGEPVEGAAVSVEARRPATERHDRVFDLQGRDGIHTGRVALGLPGYWDMRVRVERGEDLFVETFRVTL